MKITKPIKGIFFDIGWTLNYPASGDWLIIDRIFDYVDKNTLYSIHYERLQAAVLKGTEYLMKNHLSFTEEEEYEQFKVFYSMIASELPEIGLSDKAICEVAYDKVYNDDNYIFYDDVYNTLESLSHEYKLGIISDTYPSAKRILKNAGIYDYFKAVTFSCNLGVGKPDRRMYTNALEQIKLKPEETVFIDDFAKNIDGAKGCGIQGIIIQRSNKSYPDKSYNIDDYVQINDFSELKELLR